MQNVSPMGVSQPDSWTYVHPDEIELKERKARLARTDTLGTLPIRARTTYALTSRPKLEESYRCNSDTTFNHHETVPDDAEESTEPYVQKVWPVHQRPLAGSLKKRLRLRLDRLSRPPIETYRPGDQLILEEALTAAEDGEYCHLDTLFSQGKIYLASTVEINQRLFWHALLLKLCCDLEDDKRNAQKLCQKLLNFFSIDQYDSLGRRILDHPDLPELIRGRIIRFITHEHPIRDFLACVKRPFYKLKRSIQAHLSCLPHQGA